MNQLSYWLYASLLLVWALLFFGYRAYRVFLARFERERRNVQQMSELHLATIEALARAIDAKDGTAANHIHRVQAYATAVARELGLSETEVQAVKTAALLHDIGKLAVPDHILAKPGPLTPEEFQKVQAHPQVGASIIATIPFPYPVAPLILSHHERWDGRGYPSGLKGDEIPLGARILFLVDYFGALTSERPYHAAMSLDGSADVIDQ
jgi:putative nucleotidyltransferase with HDIG domain